MKVLLLGATGLLGHNVLKMLMERGYSARVLVRDRRRLMLGSCSCEVEEGSLLDDETLSRSARGCDAIVNCAGTTDMTLRNYGDYLPVNRDLPVRLAATMEKQGIGTWVQVSTVNTIGYGRPGAPADEQSPMQEPFKGSYYADSKAEGEEAVEEAASRHPEWHVVTVCPGYMIGAYDVKPSSGRMLLAAYRRRLMFAPSGGKAFVPVRDVAEAVVNAIERGRNGSRYIVVHTAGSHTIGELYAMQAREMGYRQRVVPLPDWLVRAAGRIGDGLRWLGVRTALSSRNVRQLLVREYYDSSRSLRELGYEETPLERAIVDFHRWRSENT